MPRDLGHPERAAARLTRRLFTDWGDRCRFGHSCVCCPRLVLCAGDVVISWKTASGVPFPVTESWLSRCYQASHRVLITHRTRYFGDLSSAVGTWRQQTTQVNYSRIVRAGKECLGRFKSVTSNFPPLKRTMATAQWCSSGVAPSVPLCRVADAVRPQSGSGLSYNTMNMPAFSS